MAPTSWACRTVVCPEPTPRDNLRYTTSIWTQTYCENTWTLWTPSCQQAARPANPWVALQWDLVGVNLRWEMWKSPHMIYIWWFMFDVSRFGWNTSHFSLRHLEVERPNEVHPHCTKLATEANNRPYTISSMEISSAEPTRPVGFNQTPRNKCIQWLLIYLSLWWIRKRVQRKNDWTPFSKPNSMTCLTAGWHIINPKVISWRSTPPLPCGLTNSNGLLLCCSTCFSFTVIKKKSAVVKIQGSKTQNYQGAKAITWYRHTMSLIQHRSGSSFAELRDNCTCLGFDHPDFGDLGIACG